MVERFFRDITVYLHEGSFSSVRELESSITTGFGFAKCSADSQRPLTTPHYFHESLLQAGQPRWTSNSQKK